MPIQKGGENMLKPIWWFKGMWCSGLIFLFVFFPASLIAVDPGELMDIQGYVKKKIDNYCLNADANHKVVVLDHDGDTLAITFTDGNSHYQFCDIQTSFHTPFPWKVIATINNWGSQTRLLGSNDWQYPNYCGIWHWRSIPDPFNFCIPAQEIEPKYHK